MRVAALCVYPVKAMRGVALERADVTAQGLAGDRRWMVTQEDGTFLSQRELPALARWTARISDGALTIVGPSGETVAVRPDPARRRTVRVWTDTLVADGAAAEADAILSRALGRTVRLVCMGSATERTVDGRWADGPVSFADGFPILLTATASLAEVDRRAGTAIPMARFRPNVIVTTEAPFAEDAWREVAIGPVRLDLVKPCARCVVTTTDQTTSARPSKEPLRTLADFRRSGDPAAPGVLFGWNAVVRAPGTVAVGDAVEVVSFRERWPTG